MISLHLWGYLVPRTTQPHMHAHKADPRLLGVLCKIVSTGGVGWGTSGYFTFSQLSDAFIQSDLQCIQAIHFFSMCVPWQLIPQTFVLLTQYSNTEPQSQVVNETHLSVFHSVSNRACRKRSRNSVSSAARYAFNSLF